MTHRFHIARDLSGLHRLKQPCVATVGNFDGLHSGHQAMLKHLVQKGQEYQLPPTVVSFSPFPQAVLRPHLPILCLTSFRQKISLLVKWGIQQILLLRFNTTLATLSPQAFVEQYLVQGLNIAHLLVGEDFRFGYQQKGDLNTLATLAKQYGFILECVDTIKENNRKLSSTFIREAVLAGDFDSVAKGLGRPFSLQQRVVKGSAQARQWGYPTANFRLKGEPLLRGVFLTQVHIEHKTFYGVTNVGVRPTVDGHNYLAETHILEFSGNLYGHCIKIEFLQKLREEQRFAHIEALRQQIEKDIQYAKESVKSK